MTRILFVDDDQRTLDSLRSLVGLSGGGLQPFHSEWQVAFARTGAEALQLMAESPFAALVTEVRLPDFGGLELLARTAKLYPETVRIVLAGTADRDQVLQTAGVAHQFLAKPCESKALSTAIERALLDRVNMPDAALRRIVSSLGSLPSLPSVYFELIRAMESHDVSAHAVGQIMARDVGMTAKVLQLVNSAFFGARQPILDPVAAVVYLGYDTIRALTLQIAVFSQFRKSRIPEFSIDALQQHCARVAAAAKVIAHNAGLSRLAANDCAAGGFLHDIGKLLLAASVPDRYQRALRQASRGALPLELAELQEFGATHSEVGAYLLGLWGMPESLIDMVRLHHTPPALSRRSLTKAGVVYIANIADHKEERQQIDPRCIEFARTTGHEWEELTFSVR